MGTEIHISVLVASGKISNVTKLVGVQRLAWSVIKGAMRIIRDPQHTVVPFESSSLKKNRSLDNIQ